MILSNGLGIVHTFQEHFREISHEGGKGRGKGGIETVVKKEQVHPPIVQHHWPSQVQEVGEEIAGGVVTQAKLRRQGKKLQLQYMSSQWGLVRGAVHPTQTSLVFGL